MKISCLQTNPQNNLNQNMQLVSQLIIKAKTHGAQWVVLPEMFAFMGQERERKKSKCKINEGVFKEIQNLAISNKIGIIAGSHCETIDNNNEKVWNTSVTLNSHGEIISQYRKIHLFNLRDETGKNIYCESDEFEFGQNSNTFELKTENEIWNAQTIICYDIRFPEIVRNNKKNIDVLFVPAAFTWQTGKDHWEILLRARAIENQCYVVACNQTGFFNEGKKQNYGHSMIIDPWGQIVDMLHEEVGLLTATISKKRIMECRQKLPALADRKM